MMTKGELSMNMAIGYALKITAVLPQEVFLGRGGKMMA